MSRRRVWTHRIILEAAKWQENSFVTLTYSDKELPFISSASSVASLRPKDVQGWLKRLRIILAPAKLRFFAVGEYGEKSWRPHYHVALFGYKGCARGDSRFGPQPCKCASCEMLRRTWPLGLVHQGRIERMSAQYLAGYTVKRMTKHDDERLGGRLPEFARMSLRPGIGASAMQDVARVCREYGLAKDGNVPGALQHGQRNLPLGQYLVKRLRAELGVENAVRWQKDDWLQPMREVALALSQNGTLAPGVVSDEILKRLLEEQGKEAEKVLLARRKIYERGKK